MAKKKNVKKQVKETPIIENALPQNILPMGERVEENKNIYISQPVYKEIHKFTKNKTTNESGGMLIGNVIEEFGKTNIIVNGFVEAKYCDATPTTLKFTHETWEYVHKVLDKKFPGQKIVGWIHTHPNFGIFLSEYDKFIQENFFREEYQIAFVVDPIQEIEGFYFWINGQIEKCKGFYIFDKMGVKIKENEETKVENQKESSSKFRFKDIMITLLTIGMILLVLSNLNLKSEINSLTKSQENFMIAVEQVIGDLQMKIYELENPSQNTEQKAPLNNPSGGN